MHWSVSVCALSLLQIVLLEEEEQQEAVEAAAAAAVAAAEHIGRLCAAKQNCTGSPETAPGLLADTSSAFAQADGRLLGQLSTGAVPRTEVGLTHESTTQTPVVEAAPSAASSIPCSAASAEMLLSNKAVFPINTQDHPAANAARAAARAAAASAEASRVAARAMAHAAGGLAASSGTQGLLPVLDEFFQKMVGLSQSGEQLQFASVSGRSNRQAAGTCGGPDLLPDESGTNLMSSMH